MASFEEEKIKIAVIGAGLSGLVTALCLLQHPQLDVQIYHAQPHLSDRGANDVGIPITPNALYALQRVCPTASTVFEENITRLVHRLSQATWMTYRRGDDPEAGDFRIHHHAPLLTFDRAVVLPKLATLLPPGILQFNKEMMFASDWQKHEPRSLGMIAYRRLVPMAEARDALGAGRCATACTYPGVGRFLMSYPAHDGDQMVVVAVDMPRDDSMLPNPPPARPDRISELYSHWEEVPRRLARLLDVPWTTCWRPDAVHELPRFNQGPSVLIGDAAHAMAPFQGGAVGQAIEDACVLQAVLGYVHCSMDLKQALPAYDMVRRPVALHVADASWYMAMVNAMRVPGMVRDQQELNRVRAAVAGLILDRDVEREMERAVENYSELAILTSFTHNEEETEEFVLAVATLGQIEHMFWYH